MKSLKILAFCSLNILVYAGINNSKDDNLIMSQDAAHDAQDNQSPYFADHTLLKLRMTGATKCGLLDVVTEITDIQNIIRQYAYEWYMAQTLVAHQERITSIAITPDGQKLISGSEDKRIIIWDLNTGSLLEIITEYVAGDKAIAITPDGKKFLTGSNGPRMKLWDLNKSNSNNARMGLAPQLELLPIKTFPGPSSVIVVTPDGQKIVVACLKFIKIFDIKTGEILVTFCAHMQKINGVAITSDSQKIVTGSDDKKIIIWRINGKLIQILNEHNSETFVNYKDHSGKVTAVVITPDDERIISASLDSTIKIWDLKSCLLLQTIYDFNSPICALVITTDGKQIICSSYDKTIKVWDLTEDKIVQDFIANTITCSDALAISQDGKIIVTDSDGKNLKVWKNLTYELAGNNTKSPVHVKCTNKACTNFATKQCAKCKKVYYCSSGCQKIDWQVHKSNCK